MRQTPSKNPILYSIFLYMLLAISTVVLVSTILNYFNARDIIERDKYQTSIQSSEIVKNQVAVTSSTALSITNQIYLDKVVNEIMNYQDVDVYALNNAFTQLRNYRLTIPAIESIFVYNSTADVMYSITNMEDFASIITDFSVVSSSLQQTDISQIIMSYRSHPPYAPIPTRIYDSSGNVLRYCYSFIMYDFFSSSDKRNLVMVTFSADWFVNTDYYAYGAEPADLFIIDNTGIVVSANQYYEQFTDISQVPFIQEISDDLSDTGYKKIKLDGRDYLFTYTSQDIYNWRYLQLVDLSVSLAILAPIRNMTIIVTVIVLLTGLLLSLLFSYRMYKPIRRLIQDFISVKKDNTNIMQELSLRDLLLGHIPCSNEYVAKMYERYSIGFNPKSAYIIILFSVDGYLKLRQLYTNSEYRARKDAFVAMAKEQLAAISPLYTVDMDDEKNVIILNGDNLYSDSTKEKLITVLSALQKSCKSKFSLSISVFISSTAKDVHLLPAAYLALASLVPYRFYSAQPCILFAEDMPISPETEYVYPVETEKQLLEWIKSKNREKAVHALSSILFDTQNYPINILVTTLFRVKLALSNMAASLDTEIYITDAYLLNCTNGNSHISTLIAKFSGIIAQLIEHLGKNKNLSYMELVRKINEIISLEYGRQTLSLDFIADSVALSTAYISRIYKQVTGKTILDAITKKRIDVAKSLLKSTGITSAEIAENTGFTSASYFQKTFKHVTGETPGQYRKRHIAQ